MNRIIPSVLLVLIAGCASMPDGPRVAVMPAPGKPFEVFVADDRLCRNFATTSELFRYRAATLDAQPAQCQREVRKLWNCQVDAIAHCQLDEASEVRIEHCE